ncbi:MAG: hypothetical protein IGS39_20110 [Calothrix sp. C42_A2020_038]|nr:hypothetical protein [Calothrix sp. C42_A2020_038]
MENWQKDFWQIMETLADEVERFFLGMTEMVDTFFEFTEELSEQVNNTIATEVDQYLQDIVEPFSDSYWELDNISSESFDPAFPYSVEATKEKNPACIGCKHYHGYAYGGNLLVCGMHPSGVEEITCPDWEKEEFFD